MSHRSLENKIHLDKENRMYQVNVITSPRNYDCAPTCLLMLLNYYGKEATLEELSEECQVSLIGCTAKNVKTTGIAHGLDIRAYNMDAEEVIRQDRPSIIWWKRNHFCICCGVDENDNVVVVDPDKGRYRMSKGIFGMFYAGVALFNGEPETLEIKTQAERIQELETKNEELVNQNQMLTECLLEVADIIYA